MTNVSEVWFGLHTSYIALHGVVDAGAIGITKAKVEGHSPPCL